VTDDDANAKADAEARASIRDSLADVEEGTKWSAQGQFEQAKLWRAAHLILGVPAAALAAIAGATALASTTGRVAAGIIALVSAGLSAVASSLDAAGRAESAQTSGNRYLAVQAAARVARTVDLPLQDVATARQTLSELMARRDEINAEASVTARIAYRRAGGNIEQGGQTYGTDTPLS
jgi:hypothetical protein